MKAISSPQNPLVKFVRTLNDRRHRRESGLFVAEGSKVLARARSLGWRPRQLFVSRAVAEDWADETLLCSQTVMAALSRQENPPAEIAVFESRWPMAPDAPDGLWLALEAIGDPGNLGTIIRTADAAGASGIILAGAACDPYAPESVRATMGSVFAVPLVAMTVEALSALCHRWSGEVVGVAMTGAEDFRREYRQPTLLLIGSESRGLSPSLAALAHVCVRIPMAPGPDSLNIATAAALMMYQVRHA